MMSFCVDANNKSGRISVWLDVKGMQILIDKLSNLRDNQIGHIHLFASQDLDKWNPYNDKGVGEVEINYISEEVPPDEYAGPATK